MSCLKVGFVFAKVICGECGHLMVPEGCGCYACFHPVCPQRGCSVEVEIMISRVARAVAA